MVDNAAYASFMKVNLYISGRKLKNEDIDSKSDLLCEIYEEVADNTWDSIGFTEQIKDNLNPDF